MTLTQVWGSLIIFLVCPLLGGLPLIDLITLVFLGQRLKNLGTGNVSVPAAFYHGGKIVGTLAVLVEAGKGIAAVLLARNFFPSAPLWELLALIALVMGRYWMGRGVGTTSLMWGILVYDPLTTLLVLVIGGISFTIFRDRTSGRLVVLFLFAFIVAARHPGDTGQIAAAVTLACLLAWIYQQVPDHLDLPIATPKSESRPVWRLFRTERALQFLQQKLSARKVGQKAATLSRLLRWGYPIPSGLVLNAGDDTQPAIDFLQPSPNRPFVVRCSPTREDSISAATVGQYDTIVNITSPAAMEQAIIDCFNSYAHPTAKQYRLDNHHKEGTIAVIIQQQIEAVFSGVAFSRNPLDQLNPCVLIEALSGDTFPLVSAQVTPQQYRVYLPPHNYQRENSSWGIAESKPEPQLIGNNEQLTTNHQVQIEGDGNIPPEILQQVAKLARDLETRYQSIPQDIEWIHDGEKLWLLQAKPLTTMQPIWTRKIAADVIPGLIRPLTWSLNQPLICGVGREIFTLVLGKQAQGVDWQQSVILHYSRAYLNVTLLGQIFRRLGLPPQSLVFFTHDEEFPKPPMLATLRNLPGIVRLLRREWQLKQDFEQDYQQLFTPILQRLESQTTLELSSAKLLERIEQIVTVLRKATYYSILTPWSVALRQQLLQVAAEKLHHSQSPKVVSLQDLARLACDARKLMPVEQFNSTSYPSLFAQLADTPDGQIILEQFNQWLERYGYLSEVATDVAVPRWKEDPRPVRELFAQCFFNEQFRLQLDKEISSTPGSWQTKVVQQQLDLQGKATEVYSQLLAHLRWSLLALEGTFLESGVVESWGDIFFLHLEEISQLVRDSDPLLARQVKQLIANRKSHLEQDRQISHLPYVVYSNSSLSASGSLSAQHN